MEAVLRLHGGEQRRRLRRDIRDSLDLARFQLLKRKGRVKGRRVDLDIEGTENPRGCERRTIALDAEIDFLAGEILGPRDVVARHQMELFVVELSDIGDAALEAGAQLLRPRLV